MMLTIQPIKFNTQINQKPNTRPFLIQKNDSVTFGLKLAIGKCPKELIHLDISTLNKDSKNVLEVNDIGYLAEIIKYFGPKTKKTYAIKRVWSEEKAKQQTTNPIEQMKIEAEIYKKLVKIKKIPKFNYYNGNFSKNKTSLLNNYLIMSWVDGAAASKKGVFYDFNLVDIKKIKKLYKVLNKFDEAGVMHNDLWAGNILFTKKDVNIIDFNRSFSFDPSLEVKKNNLDSFKARFLSRYFSDVYQRQGEDIYLKTYKNCLEAEVEYYKTKQTFYLKKQNPAGVLFYKNLHNELKKELKSPHLIKQNAIKTIFESDMNCAEIFAKYFELEGDETIHHYKKALRVLNNYPEIVGKEKANLIKSNIVVASKLKNALNPNAENIVEKSNEALELLHNEQIYTKEEREKPYYNLFKNFCEFNLKHKKMSDSGQSTEELFKEYSDLLKIKRLKEYFNNLQKS